MPAKRERLRPSPKRRRGIKHKNAKRSPSATALGDTPADVAQLMRDIEADGGHVIAAYREQLGGHPQILAALPIDKVEPTPYQRDVSDGHVRRLVLAMDKMQRYLDPIIAVRTGDHYETPNGNHRLTALRELKAETVMALVIPDPRVTFQILAMNVEKAHNLREKALEVARMYEELERLDGAPAESSFALEFEEPYLATLGFAYEERGRLAGGAYQSALKKVDTYFDQPIAESIQFRRQRAELLLALDDAVSDAVERLKAKGFESPYLKAFVVARINPLRFMKGPPPAFDDLMQTMTTRARGMNVDRIRAEDLSRTGGPAES